MLTFKTLFQTTMDQMAMSSVKEVVHSDECTETSHPILHGALSSTELYLSYLSANSSCVCFSHKHIIHYGPCTKQQTDKVSD